MSKKRHLYPTYPFHDTRASLMGIQQNDVVCDNSLSERKRGPGQFKCTCSYQTTVLVSGVHLFCVKSEGWVAGHLLHTLGGGWVEIPGGKISKDEIILGEVFSSPDDYDYTDPEKHPEGVRYVDDEEETK